MLNEAVTLWMLVDHVYLKPRTRLDIVLHIAPAIERYDSSAFLSNPEDIAMFQVVCDCIREKINKEVGYEANLAHADYSVKKFCDVGIHFSFESYSDKLLDFAEHCLDLMLEMSVQGIDQALVTNSLEKQYKRYKNFNTEVDVRCNNNRLLYLMPDWYHATQMEQLLNNVFTLRCCTQIFRFLCKLCKLI